MIIAIMNKITKHFFPLILLLLTIICSSKAQTTSNTFMRTFNAVGMNGGLSLEETSDGGFIGTGQHETSGAGSCDIYAYKVDGCGNPEWFKTYGGASTDGGKCVRQTSDGGYIVAGLATLGAGDYDMVLIKLDALGNIQWSKEYGSTVADYGLYVQQTNDGGYILTGFLSGLGFGATDVALIKTDALGNTQWKKVYGGAGEDWGDYVQQTSDGGYMVTGYTTSFGAGGADIYLLKVDALGVLQFSKTYGGAGADGNSSWGIEGEVTSDGGFIISGNTDSYGAGSNDVLLIKTDANGNLQWSKTFGGAADDQPRFVHQTTDKGYIITGLTTSFGAGSLDAYLIKTDSTGTLQWSKAYGGAGSDRSSAVRQALDGGYALSIVSSSFGANYFDPIFMKTDSLGVVGCYESNCATIVSNAAIIVGTGASEMIPAAIEAVPALITNSYIPTDIFLCSHCTTVPAFVPSDTITCVGDTVFFYNTTSIGSRCNENWFINGAIVTGNQDTLAFVFTTVGTHLIQLIAACGNATDTNTISIQVFDVPLAAFSNSSVCNGTATVFTDNSTIASGTISTWLWDFGDGSSLNTTQNPTHIYIGAGIYNVALLVSNSVGCADTIIQPVQVFFNPTAGFTHTDVCFGDSIYFTNTSTVNASTSIASYLWVFGDGSPTSNLQNPAHYYSIAGTYTVTLVTTTIDGCTNTATTLVNAFDAPVSAFTFSNTCLTTSAQFTNTSTNPAMGTIASWSWNFGDGSPLNTTVWSPVHLYAATGNYQVTLITYSSSLGCSDTALATITIFPMPVADFSFTDVCLTQPMNFNDLSTVPSGTIANWSWNFGDATPLISIQNPSHVYVSSGTYNVSVIVTTNNGCKDTITKSVVVHPLPNAQFSTANVCDGNVVQFTDLSTITAPDAILSWIWNLGDGSPITNTQNPSYLYSGIGAYNVLFVVVSNFGCSDSITKVITVNPNPIVNFIANDTIGCEPLCVSFQDLSSISTGSNVQLVWNFGDGNTVSDPHCFTTDSVFAPQFFNVTLTVTSDSGCVSTLSKNNYITVYPSPDANFSVQPTTVSIINPIISFANLTTGANFWNWNFGDLSTSSIFNPPPHTYSDTGSYLITLITSTFYGCLDSTYNTIIIEPDFVFYIPNAFSPNGDIFNNTFSGKGIFIQDYEMIIFDRWGNLIYKTTDINMPWDGRANKGSEIAQRDVYVYSITVKDIKNNKHYYKGTVTLIR